MVTFLSFKDTYEEQQVNAFYCNAERQDDGISLIYPFKGVVVSLTPSHLESIVGLDCDGVDMNASNTMLG
jgi:hypothetical protein